MCFFVQRLVELKEFSFSLSLFALVKGSFDSGSPSDPEPQPGAAVEESPGAAAQEGGEGGVSVHGGGVPAVPEGILWQDCRGEEMKRTVKNTETLQSSEETPSCCCCSRQTVSSANARAQRVRRCLQPIQTLRISFGSSNGNEK